MYVCMYVLPTTQMVMMLCSDCPIDLDLRDLDTS